MSFINNILNKFVKDNRYSFQLTDGEDRFLGVDIGNFSIKLAELSKEKNKIEALVLDEIVIHEDKKKTTTDDEISKMLSILVTRNNIRTKKAIFSIGNAFTNYAIVTLPKIKDKEVLKYIELNFEDFLPVRLKEVYLEWKILEKDKDSLKVLLIAVNRDIVLRYKKIAQNAKLNFYSYETEANALINSLIDRKEKEYNTILLDVRMKNSSLSLAKNGNVIKSSSLDLSVNYFDKKIKNEAKEDKR